MYIFKFFSSTQVHIKASTILISHDQYDGKLNTEESKHNKHTVDTMIFTLGKPSLLLGEKTQQPFL